MGMQLSAICEEVDDHVPLRAVPVPMKSVGIGTRSGDIFIVAEGRLVVATPDLVLPVQLGAARASTAAWGIAKSTCPIGDLYQPNRCCWGGAWAAGASSRKRTR